MILYTCSKSFCNMSCLPASKLFQNLAHCSEREKEREFCVEICVNLLKKHDMQANMNIYFKFKLLFLVFNNNKNNNYSVSVSVFSFQFQSFFCYHCF